MSPQTPKELVLGFFANIRSGRQLDQVQHYMAEHVLAHQMTAEQPMTVQRTPAMYAAHVREMLAAYGPFTLEITECIAEGDRVYVRWQQTGAHLGEVDGYAPTGLPVIEIASAVYRVENGRIAEYWIQIDRAGLELQLQRNAGSRK
ncbi:ester cyclase [Chloroflexia bacterium SDU3-3]|nr:ester cyclase [Chloroflexia bacterium SDU3-3]